jgi:hypothetical protein
LLSGVRAALRVATVLTDDAVVRTTLLPAMLIISTVALR